jgi:periplasmic protein TonB
MRRPDCPGDLSNNPSEAACLPEAVPATFDRWLLDGDPAVVSRNRSRRQRAVGVSFAIEAVLLGAVVLAPLVTSVAEPHWKRDLYIPFAPGLPIRSQRNTKPSRPGPPSKPVIGAFISTAYVRPVPAGPNNSGDPGLPDVEISSGSGETAAPAFLDLHFARPTPPVEESKKSSDKKPLKLSAGVVQAQLISRIEPRYPPLALQIRLEGTVRLRAIVGRDGRISSLEVINGHPLLVEAALEAVRQWRYRPTMLDGEPVEVETTISVVFQLHK